MTVVALARALSDLAAQVSASWVQTNGLHDHDSVEGAWDGDEVIVRVVQTRSGAAR